MNSTASDPRDKEVLDVIRRKLFYGSSNYTKSQPDIYIPHRYVMLAPSQMDGFLEKIKANLKDDEILIYVHLPFCFSECLFCNSFPHLVNKEIQAEYLENLLREIALMSGHGLFQGKQARCIYFGGGTPTSFSDSDLKQILDAIAANISLSANCSITSEAHPLTLSDARIKGLQSIGITRLSIGCQTFDPQILKRCNRRNTPGQIAHIVKSVQDAGMAINVDMMTGLPGQTLDSVGRDLDILSGIRPDAVEYIRHEIVNPLIIKLYQDQPDLVMSNDTLFDVVCKTQEWMSANVYEQNGRFSNDKQWSYRYHWLKEMPIIAFGARARSYTRTIFYDKHEDISMYCALLKKGRLPIGRFIALTQREQMYRSLLLNLQIKDGLARSPFRARFAADPMEAFAPLVAKLTDCQCLASDPEFMRLTKYGAYFVEDICDYIIDAVLKEESDCLVRMPHSEGASSSRLS